MRPEQIAKISESSHQKAFIAWKKVATQFGIDAADIWAAGGGLPTEKPFLHDYEKALRWLHSIPNGGARGDDKKSRIKRGGEMVAEGSTKGVADLFWPHPVYYPSGLCWYGWYAEMKKPSKRPKTERSKGGLKPEQIDFRNYCLKHCYYHVVCYTWAEAVEALKIYLKA